MFCMQSLNPILSWIDSQADTMNDLIIEWSQINSHSHNHKGLATIYKKIESHARTFGCEPTQVELPAPKLINEFGEAKPVPVGNTLQIIRRPEAPHKVLLVGHMDTVFSESSEFQNVNSLSAEKISGPGVADMKSGLIIMLKALEAIEKSPIAKDLGWEVLITADEEIGSPGSAAFLEERAKHHHFGLVFEPSLPDGTLISQRKSSANYALMVKGKSAHAGRNINLGKNAINALSSLIHKINQDLPSQDGFILNVGTIKGGSAVNIVPDFSICQINIRTDAIDQMSAAENKIRELAKQISQSNDVTIELKQESYRPPKPFTKSTEDFFNAAKKCGDFLNIPIKWKPSGGVCDGNFLSNAGLPTIDTLGGRGDGIHTHDEYLLLESLTERTKLVTLILHQIASGKISLSKT